MPLRGLTDVSKVLGLLKKSFRVKLRDMKVDRTLQLKYFRRRWKEAESSKERYLWAFQYAKVRYSLACRYGKKGRKRRTTDPHAPVFVRQKNAIERDMMRFWQLAHSELESFCADLNKEFLLFEMATAQNFEQASYLQNTPSSLKLRVAPDGPRAGGWSSVDQPHGWHELTSNPCRDVEEPFALSEGGSEDASEQQERLSWQEFNRKVSLFEEKMKAQRAQERAAFQKPLADAF